MGTYELQSRWIGRVTANISIESGVLLFTQTPGHPRTSRLRPVGTHEFEVVYSTGLSCFTYGLGQNHERLVFDPPGDEGHSSYFRFGPFIFTRVSSAGHVDQATQTPLGFMV